MIELIQLVVLIILAFCMFFGLGFIINMLLKTTWFPIYGYMAFVIILIVWTWGPQSLWNNVSSYTLGDVLPFLSGLAGAFLSGYTIKMLRVKGYTMF